MFSQISELYSDKEKYVHFQFVQSQELVAFAEALDRFVKECQMKYESDEHLAETSSFLKKIFFKFCSSFLPYNEVIEPEIIPDILRTLKNVKVSYPELFKNIAVTFAQTIKTLLDTKENQLTDFVVKVIQPLDKGTNVAVVTKRSLTEKERQILQAKVSRYKRIVYFTENGFRKNTQIFNEVIYIGTPHYYGDFAVNTFNGTNTYFISYEMFANTATQKGILGDIQPKNVISTIYNNVHFSDFKVKSKNIEIEQESSTQAAVEKVLREQMDEESHHHQAVEASIIYLENERFLFAALDSKLRIFSPFDKMNTIKQINFKDLEEDDYIVVRNNSDTKLIAEIADNEILKEQAVNLRKIQVEWKKKLRQNVNKLGAAKVGEILTKRYKMKTASPSSVRAWCNEDSICPTELVILLHALKYEKEKAEKIFKMMKKVQLAHRSAGRIISKKLMNEISSDLYIEIQEKGYSTFESEEFNGASFNIERVVSIDHSKKLIMPYNLMKPFSSD